MALAEIGGLNLPLSLTALDNGPWSVGASLTHSFKQSFFKGVVRYGDNVRVCDKGENTGSRDWQTGLEISAVPLFGCVFGT